MNKLLTLGYIVAWLFLACWAAHGSTLQPSPVLRQPADSTAAVMHGSIVGGSVLGDENAAYTNIRFAPTGKALFYEQSILFCGYVARDFFNLTGGVTVVYEARAHRMFQGIGCHELYSVEKGFK